MTTAFLFPGQGSQAVGMLAAAVDAAPAVRDTFAEASGVLGYDLWQLVSEGPEDALNATVRTQPALLAADVALWRVWQARGGGRPFFLAGHSLGEYAALVCAEAIGFADAVALVQRRGALMQAAVPEGEGAMAAILGMDDAELSAACAEAAAGQVVAPANFNAPGQTVIAGNRDAVARAIELASARGAKRAVMLPVSVPSHCALMAGAAGELAEVLAGIDVRTPSITVVCNVDATPVTTPDAVRDALRRQLDNPVRWTDSMRHVLDAGVTQCAECGPGKVLTGLMRRIDRAVKVHPLEESQSLDAALAAMGET